jgi:hypothetical protein
MEHRNHIRQQFDQLIHQPDGVGTIKATGSHAGETDNITVSQAQLTLIQTILEIPASAFEEISNTDNLHTMIDQMRYAFSDEILHETCQYMPAADEIILVAKDRFNTHLDVFEAEDVLKQYINVDTVKKAASISRDKTQQAYRGRVEIYTQLYPHWEIIKAVVDHEKQA